MLDKEQIDNWDHGVETTDRGPYIGLQSGGRYYPLDPRPEEFNPWDIAHHLSQVNRFAGGTKHPYSVGLHSLFCWHLAQAWAPGDVRLRKWALAHDFPEFALGDVVRPLKQLLPDYKLLEDKAEAAVVEWLDLLPKPEAGLRYIDDLAVATENRMLRPNSRDWPDMPAPDMQMGCKYIWDRPAWKVADELRNAIRQEFGV